MTTALHSRPSLAELPCRYNHAITNWFGPHTAPQKHYGFGANQFKPRYGFDDNLANPFCFGTHIVPQRQYCFGVNQYNPVIYSFTSELSHPPQRCDYKAKLIQ